MSRPNIDQIDLSALAVAAGNLSSALDRLDEGRALPDDERQRFLRKLYPELLISLVECDSVFGKLGLDKGGWSSSDLRGRTRSQAATQLKAAVRELRQATRPIGPTPEIRYPHPDPSLDLHRDLSAASILETVSEPL